MTGRQWIAEYVEEVLTLFKVFFWYFPGGSEENYDIPQTGKPVSELIFEPGTSTARY